MSPTWKRFGRRGRVNLENFAYLWKIPASPQVPPSLRSCPLFYVSVLKKNKQTSKLSRTSLTVGSTGKPSSKYKHRRTSTLLRNIRNIRICMVKKPIQPIVFVTYENERISIKNSLPFIKCVLRLSCVVHGPLWVVL